MRKFVEWILGSDKPVKRKRTARNESWMRGQLVKMTKFNQGVISGVGK